MATRTAGVEPGRIVILNGTSSSGKTTIGVELLRMLAPPHFLMSIDSFNAMRSRERTSTLEEPALDEVLTRTRLGFHRAVAGMAAGGNHVVVDYVFSQPWRLTDCLRVFDGFDVTLVGVRCRIEDATERERARGDRPLGLAAGQFEVVHAHGEYDIEVNTSRHSARECAELIADRLPRLGIERAFDRLRRELYE